MCNRRSVCLNVYCASEEARVNILCPCEEMFVIECVYMCSCMRMKSVYMCD